MSPDRPQEDPADGELEVAPPAYIYYAWPARANHD